MKHLIAFANDKGGVGKSTSAVNIAHAMKLRGKKVVLIDLDPNAYVSRNLGVKPDNVELGPEALVTHPDIPIDFLLRKEVAIPLIPGSRNLPALEPRLLSDETAQTLLTKRLREILNKFDIAVLDTPRDGNKLLSVALSAADYVLIPSDSSSSALQGIRKTLGQVKIVQKTWNPKLKVLGYLLAIDDEDSTSRYVFQGLENAFGELVFKHRVPRMASLRKAYEKQRTIFEHNSKLRAASKYRELAIEVLNRVENHEKETSRSELYAAPSPTTAVQGGLA